MTRFAIAACAVAALGLTGCAHDPQERGALRGAGFGAAAGAVAGALIPGLSVVGGAALFGAGGAAVGALSAKDGNSKHYQHDEQGRYYIDRDGRRVYE